MEDKMCEANYKVRLEVEPEPLLEKLSSINENATVSEQVFSPITREEIYGNGKTLIHRKCGSNKYSGKSPSSLNASVEANEMEIEVKEVKVEADPIEVKIEPELLHEKLLLNTKPTQYEIYDNRKVQMQSNCEDTTGWRKGPCASDISIKAEEMEIEIEEMKVEDCQAEEEIEINEDGIDISEDGPLELLAVNVFSDLYTSVKLRAARQNDCKVNETSKSNCKCEGTKYKCKDCTFETKYRRNLESYIKIRPDKDSEVLQCNYSSCQSIDKGGLGEQLGMQHVDKKRERKIYKCKICSFTSEFKKLMNIHITAGHGKSKPKCIPLEDNLPEEISNFNKSNPICPPLEGNHPEEISNFNESNPICPPLEDNLPEGISNFNKSNPICAPLEDNLPDKISNLNNVSGKLFKCGRCGSTVEFFTELVAHMKLKHGRLEDILICEDDRHTKQRKRILAPYIIANHETQTFKCTDCMFEAKYKACLIKHLKTRHNVTTNTYKCGKCSYSSIKEKDLERHVRKVHSKTCDVYKCRKCPYATNNVTYLIKHMKVKHGLEARYKCEKCEFITKNRSDLFYHVKAQHKGTAEVYMCEECPFSTKKRFLLERHMRRIHSGHKISHKCTHCTYESSYMGNLRNHINRKHQLAESLDFTSEVLIKEDEVEIGETGVQLDGEPETLLKKLSPLNENLDVNVQVRRDLFLPAAQEEMHENVQMQGNCEDTESWTEIPQAHYASIETKEMDVKDHPDEVELETDDQKDKHGCGILGSLPVTISSKVRTKSILESTAVLYKSGDTECPTRGPCFTDLGIQAKETDIDMNDGNVKDHPVEIELGTNKVQIDESGSLGSSPFKISSSFNTNKMLDAVKQNDSKADETGKSNKPNLICKRRTESQCEKLDSTNQNDSEVDETGESNVCKKVKTGKSNYQNRSNRKVRMQSTLSVVQKSQDTECPTRSRCFHDLGIQAKEMDIEMKDVHVKVRPVKLGLETNEDQMDESECGILGSSPVDVSYTFDTNDNWDAGKEMSSRVGETGKSNKHNPIYKSAMESQCENLDSANQNDSKGDETGKSNFTCKCAKNKCKCRTFKSESSRNSKGYIKRRTNEPNKKVFRCGHCPYEDDGKRGLEKHIMMQHNRNSVLDNYSCLGEGIDKKRNTTAEIYICKSCSFTTEFKKLMDIHIAACHDESISICTPVKENPAKNETDCNEKSNKFECTKCRYKTEFVSDLVTHMKLKHEKATRLLKCDECEYTIQYKGTMVSYAKVRHRTHCIMFECTECMYKAHHKDYLAKHIKMEHQRTNKKYSCGKCNFNSKEEKYLEAHVRSVHSEGSDIYKCDKCLYGTNNVAYLRLHVRREHGLHTRYKCEKCEFTTNNRQNLLYHVTSGHNENGEVYNCEKCSFTTRVARLLGRHIKTRHAVNSYKCGYCSFQSQSKAYVMRHMKRRHGGPGCNSSIEVKMDVDEGEINEELDDSKV